MLVTAVVALLIVALLIVALLIVVVAVVLLIVAVAVTVVAAAVAVDSPFSLARAYGYTIKITLPNMQVRVRLYIKLYFVQSFI